MPHPHPKERGEGSGRNGGRLAAGLVTAVVLAVGLGLELAGSFVPFWATPVNATLGNISYSLWTTDQCFDYVCETTYTNIRRTIEDCPAAGGGCITIVKYLSKPSTKCYKTDFCNKTWHHQEDPSNVPSILWVGMAFETPAMVTGLVAFVLYVVKIVLNWREPKKRLHLKAAYLTFAALAGAAAEFGVIIFCAMLEKDKLTLGWAPALCGVGGFLQLSMALGGYMGWRSVSTDNEEFEEDDISITEKFVDSRPHKKKPKTFFGRSISNTSTGSGITKL